MRSVPHVTFVVFDIVFFQESTELILTALRPTRHRELFVQPFQGWERGCLCTQGCAALALGFGISPLRGGEQALRACVYGARRFSPSAETAGLSLCPQQSRFRGSTYGLPPCFPWLRTLSRPKRTQGSLPTCRRALVGWDFFPGCPGSSPTGER